MTNFRLTIEYDGRRYSGWQRQGNTDNTIQGKIEQILSRMTGHAVEINGAGRTDAGVHARAQVANVKIRTDKTAQEIQELLNHYLPQDIAVTACEQAPERFHARLNAKGKHYRYRLCDGGVPDVFARQYVCAWEQRLDVDAMQQAAQYFIGKKDFAAVRSVGTPVKSTVREIFTCSVDAVGALVRIRVSADGFLYNMVRAISGTLLYAGQGKFRPEDIARILASCDREQAGPTLPPQGLYMTRLWYDTTPELDQFHLAADESVPGGLPI